MPKPSTFSLVYGPEAIEHFDFIERKYRGLIKREIEAQLLFTPEVQTRNRKPLEQPAPFDAT
jgi:hypothetical protein